jgi:hypothetical protein
MKIKSHSESHIVELDDGSRWQIFPGDLDLTLDWKPETDLTIVLSDDEIGSHMLVGGRRQGACDRRRRKVAAAGGQVSPEGRIAGRPFTFPLF